MNEKVIYTCLTGNYDILSQPLVVDKDFDYICFSNEIKEKRVGAWVIKPISYENNDNIRLSRYVKLMPHEVLDNYKYSVWIDANIQIIKNEFYDIVNKRIDEGHPIYQVPHPFNNCIYDDIKKAYLGGRVSLKDAKRQYRHLQKEGFPRNNGLYENGLILRNHNDDLVVRISKMWWEEFQAYSRRDQFSLCYVYWKVGFYPHYLFGEKEGIRNVDFLKYRKHPVHLSFLKRNKIIKYIGSNIKIFTRKILILLFLK